MLEAITVSKSYGAVHALRGVSFDLRAGEVHALVGENGAGKSTLIRVLTGAVQPDSGVIRVHGEPIQHNTPVKAKSLGIAAVYQQPALFADLTVAENIAISMEQGSLWRIVHRRERLRRASALLESIGARIDPRKLAVHLSMPEQQMVEIARALGMKAKILILDEPTASLTDHEVENLFRVIRELRSRGVGVVYISHRLEELFEIGDRVTVLRDGTLIGTSDMAGIDRAALIQMMAGRPLSTVFPKRQVPLGNVVLEAKRVVCRAAGVQDVSLAVRSGEIFGIAGLVGSGRTQFAETLFGLRRADGGEIILNGQTLRVHNPAGAIAAGIAYVPEDRRRHGVVLQLSIAANIAMARLPALSRAGLLDFGKERALAEDFRRRLGIKAPSVASIAGNLSGGNQQKVSLARWLATDPRVLILDEPTQGIDIGAKAEIHELIVDLAARGLAIILISSELPEILGMSDRVAVMREGRIAGVLERSEATQESILEMAHG